MHVDSYKIFISISHHRIAYEYWHRDGENKLVPMPHGKWPAPLAFYCSDTGIIIGEDAARAANTGVANSFDNYFERVINDQTYEIGGQSRPMHNLLLDATESVLRDFYRTVLYNRYGSVSENRANMPLTIVCESDIEPREKALLTSIFKDSGYGRVRTVDYRTYIDRYVKESLAKEYICDRVLVAWTEGSDLTFTLFDVNKDSVYVQKTYKGLGIDPRKDYVKKLIWEDVLGQNPWLTSRSKEEDALNKAASDFLGSNVPLVNETILLSDGQKYHYSLNRNTINHLQGNEGNNVRIKLDEFLNENGIVNRSRVLLLLRGMAAGNSYFEQNLSPGFSKTIKSDNKLRDNTMKLLISEDNSPVLSAPSPQPEAVPEPSVPEHNPYKDLAKKWRQIRAEANGKARSGQKEIATQIYKDFLQECSAVSGVDDILQEIQAEIANLTPAYVQPEPEVNEVDLRALKRKWKELNAITKAKARSGNITEAVALVKAFSEEARKIKGGEDILSAALSALAGMNPAAPAPTSPKPTPAKSPQKDSSNIGKQLIQEGKLKDARDWFRNNNDNATSKLLTDIIRAQKGVDARKNSLEQCKASKNKEQISRIIKEIQDFIDLCKKAGVNSADYTQLLTEYKKI